MAEKRTYRSALRSRRMIRDAFLELLEEKEYAKITVTDIVNRADLNRSTFYHHYPDVHGVVEEIQDEIINRSLARLRQMNLRDILEDPIPYLSCLCDTLEESIRLYNQIGHIDDVHFQFDKFLDLTAEEVLTHSKIPERVRTAPAFEIRFHLLIGGIINTYLQWSEGKMHCTLSEISQEISDLIRRFSADFLDAEWMK